MHDTPDRLLGPMAKIERAYHHIKDLEETAQLFGRGNPYVEYTEEDPETGDLVYKVNVMPQVPERFRDLSVIAGDVVHNLRSSLDLLAWQLIDANEVVPDDGAMFTIFKSRGAFESGTPGGMRGAHKDAIRVFESLKPYKGGNDSLWRLHRLDATDKHRLLFTLETVHVQTTISITLFGVTRQQPLRQDVDKPLEDRAELYRVPAASRRYFEREPDPDFAVDIAIREPDGGPGLLNLVRTMNSLMEMTGEIIGTFEPFVS